MSASPRLELSVAQKIQRKFFPGSKRDIARELPEGNPFRVLIMSLTKAELE